MKKGCLVFLSIIGVVLIGFIVLVIVLANTIGKDIQTDRTNKLSDSPIKVNSYYCTEPNSADGVSLYVDWSYSGDKEIKYIHFDLTPYNRVDDKQHCQIRYYSTRTCSLTGPFSDGANDCSYWDCVWYNRDIEYIVLEEISIEYMDGTTKSYYD